MGSMWTSIALIAVVAIISNAVVSIVRGRSGGKKNRAFKDDITRLENDLDDALERIIVLEKIVTDGKHSLRREIDDLAG
jgi:hypothetical protein